MSDDQTEQDATPATETLDVGRDWFLELLVRAINSLDEGGIGVTLIVNGKMLSGALIGGPQWFTELAQLIRRSEIPEFAETIEGVRDDFYESRPSDSPIGYVHLARARVYEAGRAIPTGNDGLFRVRIEHVSAWTLGELRPGPATGP